MTSAEVLPQTEAERLAVLESLELLDTPREDRFDRIARVAAALFDMPIAAVSLLDADRQWFKACVGLDTDGSSRADAICSRVVASGRPLVVPDLSADESFRGNRFVTEGIRFYAGQPLEVQGEIVGTLCLMDRRPRQLSEEDLARLADLAEWARGEVGAVELARALRREREVAQELLELQGRDELTLQLADSAIFGVDRRGHVTFANPATSRLLRVAREHLVGQDFHVEYHHTRADGTPFPWEDCPTYDALQAGRRQRVPVALLHRADGTPVEVEYAAAPVVLDGEVTGAVVTLSDISERRAVERLKDEFVSVVSHELRTPLTSIRGSLGLLASDRFGALPPQASRLVDIALTNTDRLARLVNDILDLDRMEAGRVELDRAVQPVAALLAAAEDAVAGAASHAGVRLVVRPTAATADVDGELVVRALVNLLGNAVKFSPRDEEVVVEAVVDGPELQITVTDRGRGIPAEQVGRLFERFEQVDASDSREKGGTGLGLTITRSIAQLHGGRVEVVSELGRGSTFTLFLPVAGDGVQASRGRTGTAVVVEDDRDLAEVLVAGLETLGLGVRTAAGAGHAVEVIRAARPDLVVLDVELAEGDGYAVVEQLRADPALSSVPLIVATVHDLDAEHRRRLVLGPTTFVAKGGGGVAPVDAVDAVVQAARFSLGLA